MPKDNILIFSIACNGHQYLSVFRLPEAQGPPPATSSHGVNR